MNDKTLTSHTLSSEDYSSIEKALRETPTGTFFLKEYAKRNASVDYHSVLGAIEKLQNAMASMEQRMARLPSRVESEEKMRRDHTRGTMGQGVYDGLKEIEQTLLEARSFSRFVAQTEKATKDIVSASETLSSIANHLSKQNFSTQLCTDLQAISDSLFASCSLHELAGQKFSQLKDLSTKAGTQLEDILKQEGVNGNAQAGRVVKASPQKPAPAKVSPTGAKKIASVTRKGERKQKVKPPTLTLKPPQAASQKPVNDPKQPEPTKSVQSIDPKTAEVMPASKQTASTPNQTGQHLSDYIKVDEYGDLSAIKEGTASQTKHKQVNQASENAPNLEKTVAEGATNISGPAQGSNETAQEKTEIRPPSLLPTLTEQEVMERKKKKEQGEAIIASSVSLTEALRRMREMGDATLDKEKATVEKTEDEVQNNDDEEQANTVAQVPEDLMDRSASFDPARNG